MTSTPSEAKNQLRQWPSVIGKQKLSDIVTIENDDEDEDEEQSSFNDIFDNTSIF